MTEEREFYAASVDEAVSKAAEEIGLPAARDLLQRAG